MKKIIPILTLIMVLFTISSCKKSEDMLTAAEQLKVDIEIIQNFIALNNLDAQSTNSGLHYVITEEGHGDDYPSLQDEVKVRYKGFYASDGGIFDQNLDVGNPTPFVLANTIEGWREGIPYFKKGAKGMLLIPSGLAYGPYPPPGVNANAVMIFEIELLDFF